jgi:hypothetical protein
MTINLNKDYSLTISGPTLLCGSLSVIGRIYPRKGKCRCLNQFEVSATNMPTAYEKAKKKAYVLLAKSA